VGAYSAERAAARDEEWAQILRNRSNRDLIE
jgi:hypothetical protein